MAPPPEGGRDTLAAGEIIQPQPPIYAPAQPERRCALIPRGLSPSAAVILQILGGDSKLKPFGRLVRISVLRSFAPLRWSTSDRTIARSRSTEMLEDPSMKLRTGSTTVTIALLACILSTTNSVAQTRTLYDRLGGYPAISAVVDDFVANVAADRRINRFFANANIDRLKARLVEQICQGTGGPCSYSGGDMKSVHAGMGIQGKHFNALVGDLGKTLNKFKVPAREQKELVAILAPMKKDIVTR
jgi:hemoglobin